jgi:hypothetical protein
VATEAPAGVVFSSTDTALVLRLATARSGRPSPLKSPAARPTGEAMLNKIRGAAKEGVVAPAGVVFRKTSTVLSR